MRFYTEEDLDDYNVQENNYDYVDGPRLIKKEWIKTDKPIEYAVPNNYNENEELEKALIKSLQEINIKK